MFGLPSVYAYTRTHFSFYYWSVFPYITQFVYPIGLIAQTSSAYLTLSVTIERYVAVCRPLKVSLERGSTKFYLIPTPFPCP